MYILRTDGSTEALIVASMSLLTAMQNAVGGYIEIVPTIDGRVMVINEEGKLMGLPFNEEATALARIFADDYIVGDVIIAEDGEID